MTLANTSTLTQRLLFATLGTSEYNLPQPQIEMRISKGTHFRKINAMVHNLAAEIEGRTSPTDKWIVQADIERGRVCLELATGDLKETERAMTILRQIAATYIG